MSSFDFDAAQKYELQFQRGFITKVFLDEFAAWKERMKQGIEIYWEPFINPEINAKELIDFKQYVKGKNCLDIGCGSTPYIKDAIGMSDKIVIDPLAQEYHSMELQLFNTSFFEDMTIIAVPCEQHVSGIFIDGFIMCRNMLDHSEDPLQCLNVLSQYADEGCYLLEWSDIWHNNGGGPGHRCITKSPDAMQQVIEGFGWEFICSTPAQRHEGQGLIEFGGVFRKI